MVLQFENMEYRQIVHRILKVHMYTKLTVYRK